MFFVTQSLYLYLMIILIESLLFPASNSKIFLFMFWALSHTVKYSHLGKSYDIMYLTIY